MSTRRDAREWAVQVLFQLDLNPGDVGEALSGFWEDKDSDKKARAFTEDHVRGVVLQKDRIDKLLGVAAEHWDIARMSVVDRNVMRMAIYEMLACDDIPPVVSINEAVDLAKYFNTGKSGKFVNGILDRVRKELENASS